MKFIITLLLTTLLFHSQTLTASIFYTDIPDGVPAGIDFDQDGNFEFEVDAWPIVGNGDYLVYWNGGPQSNIHAQGNQQGNWDVPECVNAGFTIDASGNWIGAGDCAINGWGGGNPSLVTGQDTYLAMKIDMNNNIYYGWVRINVDGAGNVTYKDYAYNDTPNTSINAGDNGQTGNVPVTSIAVQGQGGAITVSVGGNLQMEESVLPANATDNSVTWSVTNGTGTATINPTSGVLNGTTAGTVTVIATANDGSGVTGNTTITVVNNNIPVNSITVQGQGGATTVTQGGTLQMEATVLPANATNNSVTWSVANGTGTATINSTTGVLSGTGAGTVTVTATANDGSGVTGNVTITVVVNNIPVTSITIQGQGGATTVAAGANLQMVETVLPANATDNSVTWNVVNGTGTATINPTTGILTGGTAGTVTVTATANDGSGVSGSTTITVTSNNIPVQLITVTGQGGATSVNIGSTLQMVANILPANASNQNVTWSVNNQAVATIDVNGLLTPVSNGIVFVTATAQDGSGVSGTAIINVPPVLIQSITVTGQGGATTISTPGGSLQMQAAILPLDATNQNVTWMVDNQAIGIIDGNGLLTAVSNGTVLVTAMAQDGSGISGSVSVVISNQTVGINSIDVLEVSVFPNPVSNVLNIELSDNSELSIYDLSGKLVWSGNNLLHTQVNVSSWEKGVYLLKTNNEHQITTTKIVVQ